MHVEHGGREMGDEIIHEQPKQRPEMNVGEHTHEEGEEQQQQMELSPGRKSK